MNAQTIVRTDGAIQAAVKAQFGEMPELRAAAIEADVANGAVTLSGTVSNYSDYLAAGAAASRSRGVVDVRNCLKVHPNAASRLTDAELDEIAKRALLWSADVPSSVTGYARDRDVTLTGEVGWHFQREAAQHVVERISGVSAVDNQIVLIDRCPVQKAEASIMQAMRGNAQIDPTDVAVTIIDNTAVLTGCVASHAERNQAGLATWASPEVTALDNRLKIRAR